MVKIRRGDYVFLTMVADHKPRHVHIYRRGRLIARWNIELWGTMTGHVDRRLRRILGKLREEGRL